MKKLFSLLLACMMLFLTSCNHIPPNGTTTGNLQNQEKPKDSELKDTIIQNGTSKFIDIPSRVIFESGKIFYYSKADGKAYVYCFDPLCDHSGGKCLANPMDTVKIYSFDFKNTFFINNRFYTATQYGQIYSFAFDGSDLKIEYGEDSYSLEEVNRALWSPNYRVYDKYIYIPLYADEKGNSCTLRFNTETKEMEDLTEETGNSILPHFFYNGEIYGRDAKLRTWVKADLELKKMEPIEEPPISMRFFGSVFYSTAYDDPTDYKNGKSIGIQAYDIKTGETTILTNEILGLEAYAYEVIDIDENYVYFYQWEEIEIGKDQKNRPVENNSGGKLYRVKHDGTECVCIFNDPSLDFIGREAVVTGNEIIIEGHSVGMRDGYATTWDSGMKVGTMGEDGKIEKFEPIELVY